MKLKINKIITLSALIVGFSACEVTDVDPANRIPESVAFGDKQRVAAAVNGAYEAAQQGFYAGAVQRGYPFGAASTEQGEDRKSVVEGEGGGTGWRRKFQSRETNEEQ